MKVPILKFQLFWWKFAKFLVSFSEPQISFSSNFAWLFSIMKDNLFRSNVIYIARKGPIKVQIFETFECSDQNSKALSFLKQHIGFSSNFASLFSVMRHNYFLLFKLKFYIASTKGAYQSTNLVKRRLISHDIEEWCKV